MNCRAVIELRCTPLAPSTPSRTRTSPGLRAQEEGGLERLKEKEARMTNPKAENAVSGLWKRILAVAEEGNAGNRGSPTSNFRLVLQDCLVILAVLH